MTGQQLKNSILQEAIEGRLAPQDPNDEPASVLLERIRAEKARLVKEKKIKKDKNESRIYRTENGHWMEHFEDKSREDICIDEEIPFDLPSGWEWCRFGNIQYLLTDGTHSRPQYVENGIPFLSVKDISSGKISFDNVKYISLEEHEKLSKRCNPQIGDLLISKVGTTGIPVIVDTNREFSLFVSVALIKFFKEYINSSFLLLLINSPLVQEQVKRDTRGVGNKNWVLSAIYNTLLVLPPLAEQHRIVEKIESLLPKVEAYGKAQEELEKLNEALPEQLKRSILQEAIEGRLVPQDPNDEPASVLIERIRAEKARLVKEKKIKKDKNESRIYRTEDGHWMEHFEDKSREDVCIDEEIPYDVPSGWEWCRIGHLVYLIMGQSPEGGSVNELGNGIEFHQGKIQFSEMYIKESNLYTNKATKIVEPNTPLLCVRAPVGEVNITKRKICIGRGLCGLELLDNISEKFIYYFLQPLKSAFLSKATGSTFLAISSETIYNQLFPLPPLAEQHRIVEKLEEILPKLNNLKKETEK